MREVLCGQYGRPSLTPGIYFRSLLIGYFEGIGGGARFPPWNWQAQPCKTSSAQKQLLIYR